MQFFKGQHCKVNLRSSTSHEGIEARSADLGRGEQTKQKGEVSSVNKLT